MDRKFLDKNLRKIDGGLKENGISNRIEMQHMQKKSKTIQDGRIGSGMWKEKEELEKKEKYLESDYTMEVSNNKKLQDNQDCVYHGSKMAEGKSVRYEACKNEMTMLKPKQYGLENQTKKGNMDMCGSDIMKENKLLEKVMKDINGRDLDIDKLVGEASLKCLCMM